MKAQRETVMGTVRGRASALRVRECGAGLLAATLLAACSGCSSDGMSTSSTAQPNQPSAFGSAPDTSSAAQPGAMPAETATPSANGPAQEVPVQPTGLVPPAATGDTNSQAAPTPAPMPAEMPAPAGPQHWVGTWTASPYFDSGNQPPASLSNSVLRQIAHVSMGGSQLRVQFSNLNGNGPVTINAAHIARCNATPAVDSTIDMATDQALAFSGMPSVTIPQGQEIWSDPIDFTVPSLGNITITTAFGNVPSNVMGHSGSRTTSYLQGGSNNVSAASMAGAQTTDHWYYISGIDVMADAAAVGAVAIGDSITDGRGTDTNRNNRWTDILSARLQADASTAHVSMMNQGIGATNLVGNAGTAAQARFNRDVLGQSGIRYAIVFDGVNDIGGNAQFAPMKAAYDDLIARAHAKGVLIYGATILPFGGNSYYTAAHENVRQQVNAYIRSGVFDGVIDFEAAVTDGGNPPKLQATFAAWAQQDGLHPGPAGYQKIGESADLSLFTK